MVLITAAICVTCMLITLAVCHTTLACVQFKYRDQEKVLTPEQHQDIQKELDEQREKDKIPTMDELVSMVQQVIGGDEDGE